MFMLCKWTGVKDERVTGLSLDERAVVLACAVTIDIDYFSRHSGSRWVL